MKKTWIIFLVALVMVLAVGCASQDSGTVPEPEQQELSSPAADSAEAGSAEEEGLLPDAFPKDFPIYPGAEIWQSSEITESSCCVKWQTADSIEQVVEFYERELPNAGYEWEKTVNCREYQYFKDPDSYSQLTIIDRNSPQFNKDLSGDTQIIYSD